MRTSFWTGACLTAAIALTSGLRPLSAVELRGTTFFERPPSLVGATTTRDSVNASRPTYYFTIDVPDNAGEPLQQIAIAQHNNQGVTGNIQFDLEETRAFVGTRRQRGDALPLQSVSYDRDTRTLVIDFAPTVAPGQTVTIALKPRHNPRRGGVYLFGVTAFPEGSQPHGQFLGYGRLQFYERDGGAVRFSQRGFWPY